MNNHQAVLMSIDLRCAYSHPSIKMRAVEYRQSTMAVTEKAVYECPICGRRKLVVHRPEEALACPYSANRMVATRSVKQSSNIR